MNNSLFRLSPELQQRTLTGFMLALLFLVCAFIASSTVVSSLLFIALMAILIYEWPHFKAPYLTVLYPFTPFIFLIRLSSSAEHMLLPWMIVIVALYEISAYGIGKSVGTIKLCPTISPGKTWEGVIGGYLVTCMILFFYYSFIKHSASLLWLIPVTVIISAATIGDLFESWLKRRAHLKDAGSLLPGHGGLLDRFDGLLGAILVVYPLRSWFATVLELT
jgi:phosphatidate cytidylyltransferase